MAFLFETETCGRCGGTGNYSYNRMHGTVCYGCAGNKVRLTKRGKAAQAWLVAQQSVPVSALQVGDLVREEDFFAGVVAWMRVDGVEAEGQGFRLQLSYQRKHEADRRQLDMVAHASATKRVRSADKTVRLWQQMVALAYQASLTKDGKARRLRRAA
jgi:hypothetical protein